MKREYIMKGEIKAETVKYKLDDHISQQQRELRADIDAGIKYFNTNTQPRAENYNPSTGAVHDVVTSTPKGKGK